jgi:hypothetical protein
MSFEEAQKQNKLIGSVLVPGKAIWGWAGFEVFVPSRGFWSTIRSTMSVSAAKKHVGDVSALSVTSSDEKQVDSAQPSLRSLDKRVLSARQVTVFAIAGSIGANVFVNMGIGLTVGGPLSLLLAYAYVRRSFPSGEGRFRQLIFICSP